MIDPYNEFLYTAADFGRISRLLHDHAGIALVESKRSMVYNRLVRRLRARNLSSVGDYLDLIATDRAEWTACIDALTTNVTAFFREAHHFEIMADYVRRRHLPRLRIWCAAAATGEEPYSIAMTMIEAYDTEKPPVEIIASDIDTEVLAHAQRGVYALQRLAAMSEQRRARFFQGGNGPNTGYVRVRPELRTLIDYRRINLQAPSWRIPANLDLIVCRNVLLYFQADVQERIFGRFGSLIADDGLLITGQADNLFNAGIAFTALGQGVYRPTIRAAAREQPQLTVNRQ